MNNSPADRRSPLGLFPGGQAPLPDALARKYPNADRERGWQWVFPASSHTPRAPTLPRSGLLGGVVPSALGCCLPPRSSV